MVGVDWQGATAFGRKTLSHLCMDKHGVTIDESMMVIRSGVVDTVSISEFLLSRGIVCAVLPVLPVVRPIADLIIRQQWHTLMVEERNRPPKEWGLKFASNTGPEADEVFDDVLLTRWMQNLRRWAPGTSGGSNSAIFLTVTMITCTSSEGGLLCIGLQQMLLVVS